MSCENTTERVADRLKGLLSPDDERRLQAHLATCDACREEAASMNALWSDMGALAPDVPHERMRARFHAALAAYEERSGRHAFERFLERVWPERPALQAGLAAALMLVGVLVGQQFSSSADGEIAALRDEIRTVGLALLDHQSASERLLGVAWSRRGDAAPPVIDALLERVQYDPNVNVRLAAVEALRVRIDRPEVGAGLARALAGQDAPIVQVTLADALLESGASDAVAAVRSLLDRDGLDPTVREFVRTALQESDADSAAQPDV
jgi:hypothetical protein